MRFGCSRYGQTGVPGNRVVFKLLRNGVSNSEIGTSLLYSLVEYVDKMDKYKSSEEVFMEENN